MVFDPSDPDIDPNDFPDQDWSMTEYGDVTEQVPNNIPPLCWSPRCNTLGETMPLFTAGMVSDSQSGCPPVCNKISTGQIADTKNSNVDLSQTCSVTINNKTVITVWSLV